MADQQAMRRIALRVEYDGTRFHGFQIQLRALTIQGVLEDALQTLLGQPTRIYGAGRTDTGVHAVGQVATFVTTATHDTGTFQRALNARLPADVAVTDACEVGVAFDVRRHARRRWYRYVMLNREASSPLLRHATALVRGGLDTTAMAQAAALLVGQHDLASFSGTPSKPTTTVRRVFEARVTQMGPFVLFDMHAEAFLPQQVRRTAGVLLEIGKGAYGLEQVRHLLEQPVLGAADHAAPPQGLYLMNVEYPDGAVHFSVQSTEELVPFSLITK
ncbi:MAG: tRNA pseudouridine(38-40) synthase TruA [Dehalococcoidia bacterium]|nr:tRNA pseudouridine(38-40) synthase TruA [Dehalococcoidia bacterium]